MARSSTLVELNSDGIALLEDKSLLRIAPGHLKRISADWKPGIEIVIERSRNAMWQYTLNAAGSTVKVDATPSSGKLVLGSSMRDVKTALEMHNSIQG